MKATIVSKAFDNYSGARSKDEVAVDGVITGDGIFSYSFVCTTKTPWTWTCVGLHVFIPKHERKGGSRGGTVFGFSIPTGESVRTRKCQLPASNRGSVILPSVQGCSPLCPSRFAALLARIVPVQKTPHGDDKTTLYQLVSKQRSLSSLCTKVHKWLYGWPCTLRSAFSCSSRLMWLMFNVKGHWS